MEGDGGRQTTVPSTTTAGNGTGTADLFGLTPLGKDVRLFAGLIGRFGA
jgi:hypothetical protein